MIAILPVAPVEAGAGITTAALAAPSGHAGVGFGALLEKGLTDVETRIAHADQLVQAYARGDSIPVHQVTLALEQARVAVELAVQVRSKLVETYRDFMSMQL